MKKELRFGFALMAIILTAIAVFMPWGNLTNGRSLAERGSTSSATF